MCEWELLEQRTEENVLAGAKVIAAAVVAVVGHIGGVVNVVLVGCGVEMSLVTRKAQVDVARDEGGR